MEFLRGCTSLLGVVSVRLSLTFWFELVPQAKEGGGQASYRGDETGRKPGLTACVVTLAWPKESLELRVLGMRGAPNGA